MFISRTHPQTKSITRRRLAKSLAGFFILSLSLPLAQVGAQEFTAFPEVDYRGDWQTLPEEAIEVVGGQRLWFVSPVSWRKGGLGGSAKVTAADAASITLEPKNVWSDYAITIAFDEPQEASGGELPDKRRHALHQTSPGLYPQLIGEDVLVGLEITEVLEMGKRFRGQLRTGEGDLAVIVTATGETPKKDRMPDIRDLRYGPHAKHVIDIYYPEGFDPATDAPLPTIVNIHGGGWGALHKDNIIGGLRVLDHGYAIASVAYRYLSEADNPPGEMSPPVTAPLYDAARAVQHLRYHAEELGLDPDRFGATGGSAGGATSIWLALHDDLADPGSDDPIARMSTRIQAAVPIQAQSSLDLAESREWVPGMTYGGHAFFKDFPSHKEPEKRVSMFMERRDEILDWIREFSPIEHVSADDPPLFARNAGRRNVPEEDTTHHPRHTEVLVERMRAAGAPAWFWAENQDSDEPRYNGRDGVIHFWDDHLKP